MNCSKVLSQLSLYLDEKLDDLSRKRVDFHIQKCPVCSQELATLAKTIRLIRAVAANVPDNLPYLIITQQHMTDDLTSASTKDATKKSHQNE